MTPREPPALTPQSARALMRSLLRGTGTPEAARYIHVGHTDWLAAQHRLLGEIAEDGHSDTKFVRGAYGAGKSHFLAVVQDYAREKQWMTSHIECKVDGVQIDRFETLYPQIVAKLLGQETSSGDNQADVLTSVLDRWTSKVMRAAGIHDGGKARPLEADNRLMGELQRGLLRTNLPPDFARALCTYSRASIADDFGPMQTVRSWLRGVPEKAALPNKYLTGRAASDRGKGDGITELRPISKGSASEVMRGLLWLIRGAGYHGLVLCIDEVEELARLGSRRRQDQALQALREYVDNAGGNSSFRHLLMYLAATPEMFEGENYFPRYDALATRIQPVSGALNWRAPVIDLDKTPLSREDMRVLAARLWAVYRTGYPHVSSDLFTAATLNLAVDAIADTRVRIAKPRLLTRLLIEEFEQATALGGSYAPPDDFAKASTRTAAALASEEGS